MINPRNKFGAKKKVVDGLTFDSQKEGRRYESLRLMEKAGQIKNLTADKKQLRFALIVNGVKIGQYTADFIYEDSATGKRVTEDCKGVKTRDYLLRKKLMLALYGVEIYET